MKLRYLTFLFTIAASKAFSQQCAGDACEIVSTKKNPTTVIAWQFTNNSNSAIKIGLKRDLSGCSSTNYYVVAAHQQFNWGIGSQSFCEPFEAIFVDAENAKPKYTNNAPTGKPPVR